MIKARDVMTTSVVTVRPDDTIEHAIERLLRHRISGLPVVDEANNLIGIISEYDLLHLLFDSVKPSGSVADCMNDRVVTVLESDSIVEVTERFVDGTFRRLPVVRGGKLVGMISRHDLIRLIRDVRNRLGVQLAAGEASAN